MVGSFRAMARHTQTHRHCQILSPLALWAGGEKTNENAFLNIDIDEIVRMAEEEEDT